MTINLNEIIVSTLDNMKGENIVELDVTELSHVMDTLIIVTGTSSRHVKSMANKVVEEAKEHAIRPLGTEGMEGGEWVLVDYGDTVVHVMLEATREFYELEKLWSMEPSSRKHTY